MSFKQKLKDSLKSLKAVFNELAQSPYPEPEIQKEMEAEGWTFKTHCSYAGAMYFAGPFEVTYVHTPEGRPALNGGPAPEDKQRYKDTLAQKRAQHGLTP
ncbi:MAG: hypothetical protein ACXW30_03235 [Micavibrio sp.]